MYLSEGCVKKMDRDIQDGLKKTSALNSAAFSPRDIESSAPCTSPEEAKRTMGSLRALRASPLSISFALHAVHNVYHALLLKLFDCSVDSASLISLHAESGDIAKYFLI